VLDYTELKLLWVSNIWEHNNEKMKDSLFKIVDPTSLKGWKKKTI